MAWPQDAYVGQKVARCKAAGVYESISPPLHTELTVSWVGVRDWFGEAVVLIDTVEYPAPLPDFGCEPGWVASYFEPVQSTQTGYEILAKLQNPTNHKQLEDA